VAEAANGTSSTEPILRPERGQMIELEEDWDDRAATDVKQLVALLFVAAEPLRQAELSKQLGIGQVPTDRPIAGCAPIPVWRRATGVSARPARLVIKGRGSRA
jgi:hypothetical protein